MNEQGSMMNQHQQQQLMNQQPPPMMSQHQQQTQVMQNRPQMMMRFDSFSVNNQKDPRFKSGFRRTQNSQNSHNYSQILMNPPPPQAPPQQMMNRSYGMWAPPPRQSMDHPLKFQNPNHMKFEAGGSGFVSGGKQAKQLGPRNNWKGKKVNKTDKRKDLGRRMEKSLALGGSSSTGGPGNVNVGIGGGYKPPTLNELQYQNRVKARRFFPKKNFNNFNNNKNNYGNYNKGKFAPRNTTSFIIRAKKSGGIAEMVSPCPVTPAVLPTPIFSPSREVLVDMAKEEWGVDGYGSMKGLIRLRSSPGHETVEGGHDDEEEDEGGSSESDVEEHVEVERRLDHDLSRFEMIYPNYRTMNGVEYNNILENRVDDQDTHIAQLEEENLILKERLYLMERELGDLRRRMQCLERQNNGGDYINEEVVENESENESESHGDANSTEVNNEEMVEENVEADGYLKGKEENKNAQGAEVIKNEQIVVDIGVHEEKIDENHFQDVEVKEQNNDIKFNAVEENVSVEAPETKTVGADVCTEEVTDPGKEIVAESVTRQEAAGDQGLE